MFPTDPPRPEEHVLPIHVDNLGVAGVLALKLVSWSRFEPSTTKSSVILGFPRRVGFSGCPCRIAGHSDRLVAGNGEAGIDVAVLQRHRKPGRRRDPSRSLNLTVRSDIALGSSRNASVKKPIVSVSMKAGLSTLGSFERTIRWRDCPLADSSPAAADRWLTSSVMTWRGLVAFRVWSRVGERDHPTVRAEREAASNVIAAVWRTKKGSRLGGPSERKPLPSARTKKMPFCSGGRLERQR